VASKTLVVVARSTVSGPADALGYGELLRARAKWRRANERSERANTSNFALSPRLREPRLERPTDCNLHCHSLFKPAPPPASHRMHAVTLKKSPRRASGQTRPLPPNAVALTVYPWPLDPTWLDVVQM